MATAKTRPPAPARLPAAPKEPRRAAADGEGQVPTLKAFSVLGAVATAERPMSMAELAVRLGMPKPTAYRIARLLEGEGLLEREAGGRRFVAGRRLLGFALDIVAASVRTAPRHTVLEALSRQLGETVNLGVMVGNQVVYIDRVEAAWPFGLRFEPGSRVPLHCTAMGKLFLSAQPRARQEQIIGKVPLERYTENTITDPQRLLKELEQIRAEGISTDHQEFLAGVVCVAVPVLDAAGNTVAGLAVSAPMARMTLKQALQHVPALRGAAAGLADTLVVPEPEAEEEPPADEPPARKRRAARKA
ncbi:IclR family transcriptional regulator [Azospirillum sp. ST 5-10]|uniref:IclR family transcriptional regulator n=1 Tax=unclassified Azospirillum TaxID=2630922 RepID=UPI003F4A594A